MLPLFEFLSQVRLRISIDVRAIYNCFTVNYLFLSFAYFSTGLLVFLLLIFRNLIYNKDIILLFGTCIANIFPNFSFLNFFLLFLAVLGLSCACGIFHSGTRALCCGAQASL